MKKVYLLMAGLLFLVASCSSEEAVVEEKNAFSFDKSIEMVNFERNLQTWMVSGKGKGKPADVSKLMQESAVILLNSLNVDKAIIVEKEKAGGNELVNLAMKEYSKKLTEMYKQNKTN